MLNILLLLSFFLYSGEYVNEVKNPNLKNLKELEDATNFFIVGDWGRNGYFGQKEVAETMHEAGIKIEPEFIISVGDNFYPNGVQSVHDPLFRTSFEDIYTGHQLYCNWYVALGNHDYRGNPQAEIDYTNISRRWQMPSRYFYVDIPMEDESGYLRLVVIDTNPLEDEYYTDETYRHKVTTQDTTAQLKWLNEVLSSDEPKWKIVAGHHPLYTGGKRIKYVQYQKFHLEHIFEKYKVDVYFNGHEHDLQHLKPKDKYTHHFLSGAGSEIRPTGMIPDISLWAASQHGFMIAQATEKELLIHVINEKGENIYSYSIKK